MLKWRDYEEDGTLFEVFLPEHDRESSSALLRAVCRGHIVAERWVHLTWRPTFGPDEGDVAALDAELDGLIVELASKPAPETGGSYVPGPVQIEPPDPFVHAEAATTLTQFQSAMAALEMDPVQVGAWLALPDGCSVDDLFPVALTPPRAHCMRKAIALQQLVDHRPEVHQRRKALVAALLCDDVAALRDELEAAGISTAGES